MTVGHRFASLGVAAIVVFACGTQSGGGLSTGAGGEIVIGGLATLEGPFAVPGQDSFRGMDLAIDEFGAKVAGKTIRVIKEGSDATPAVARDKARKLIEQDKVDFMIGPLSGDEGLAVRDYAKTQPNKTFLNGTSAAQDTTLRDAAPNFYRFTTDGVQWMAGVGNYAFQTKGYHKMAVVAEDYSFPYSQVAGFMTEFCRAGGHVTKKFWVPIGTKDYSSVVTQMPADIDAVYVALGGADAINFLKAYTEFGGKAPIVGGSITVDQTVLSTKGNIQSRLVGVPAAGPIADNDPDSAWTKFVDAYKKKFPDGLGSPSLFAHGYYIETKAALLGLQKVNGDLSGNQQQFKDALAKLSFDTPTGVVKLDHNRNAIADIFLTETVKNPDGTLFNKLIKVTHNVNQTLGVPEADFLKNGPLGRDNPSCP